MKRIFKVILITLIACSVRFIFSNIVSATTISYQGVSGSAFSQADFNDIQNSFNNVKGNAQYYYCTLKLGYNSMLTCVDSSNFKMLVNLTGSSQVYTNDTISYRTYWLLGGGRTQYIGTYTQSISEWQGMAFDYTNSLPWVCGNIPLYNSNGIDVFWAPDGFVADIPPSIENFKNQNVVNSMIARRIF